MTLITLICTDFFMNHEGHEGHEVKKSFCVTLCDFVA
jgi:hypothetical protein